MQLNFHFSWLLAACLLLPLTAQSDEISNCSAADANLINVTAYQGATRSCAATGSIDNVAGQMAIVIDQDGSAGMYGLADNSLTSNLTQSNVISCSIAYQLESDSSWLYGSGCVLELDGEIGTGTIELVSKVSETEIGTLTAEFYLVPTETVELTSARLTVSAIGGGGADDLDEQAVQSTASKVQTGLTVRNIQKRIDGRSGSSLVLGWSLGGLGGTDGGISSGSTTADTGARLAQAEALLGDENGYRSRPLSFGELLNLASFDSSVWQGSDRSLAAAEGLDDAAERRRRVADDAPMTVWGHGAYSFADNNAADYEGDIWAYNMGADVRITPALLAGLSLGFGRTALDTNGGDGGYDEDSVTLAPYALWTPSKGFAVSAIAGYGCGFVETGRAGGVDGESDSHNWFAAFDASFKVQHSDEFPLQLTAQLGMEAGQKSVQGYDESDGTHVDSSTVETFTLEPGIEAAYALTVADTVIQPFASVSYVLDRKDEINDDNQAIDLAGGLRFIPAEGRFSGAIEGEAELSRRDYQRYGLNGILAYRISIDGENGQSSFAEPYIKSSLNQAGGQFVTMGVAFGENGGRLSAGIVVTRHLARDTAKASLRARIRF